MRKAIIALAIVLIVFVLVGSVVLHFTGSMRDGDITQQALWKASVAGGSPETLKAIDLTGDGEDEVFVQTPAQVAVFSAEGQALLSQDVSSAKTTMGDLNGDGVDEFAVAEPVGGALRLAAYNVEGDQLWETLVPDVGMPARGLSLDFESDGKREVFFGTDSGVIVVLDGETGELRWTYTFPPDATENLLVRGTDDVLRGGRMALGAAVYGGHVALLDERGEPVWELIFPEPLRRLRAFDMDGDGNSEILLGGLNGQVWLVSAEDGTPLWTDSIGSRVNEARFLELDGDPTRTEVVVGGKNGGVVAYSLAGDPLWKRRVTGKVLELATLDYDEDGDNELLVAADKVSLLEGGTGRLLSTLPVAGATTLDIGDFGKLGAYLVGTWGGVSAFKLSSTPLPLWYSPIVVGLPLSLIIAVVAVVLTRFDWWTPVKVTYTVQDMSLEALRARKKMLREVLKDLERMQSEGQITAENYLAQSRSLREQMASVEGQILELQPDYKPELMNCPGCGAPVDIGMDRCPYCGHVLL